MKYTRLSKETQQQITEQTIAQIESEHYANQLALQRAEVTGNEANIEALKKTIADLEAQHKALVKEPAPKK